MLVVQTTTGIVPVKSGGFFKNRDMRLFLGDAMEALQGLSPEFVVLIFADLPCGISNGGSTCHANRRVAVGKSTWDKNRGTEEDFEFHSA